MSGRPPAPRRVLAWWYTGPLGHLYGGVADAATLFARYAWARAHGRRPDLGEPWE